MSHRLTEWYEVPPDRKLNVTDAGILDALQRDGRLSYAEIGATVGMSGPSAHERVKKLEARGIIRGYMASVDPVSVGLGVLAFMWVTQAPGTIADDLAGDFATIPEVEACHRIAGEGDYLLKIRASDTGDLERLVRMVQGTRHVYRTETDVVFSTPFEWRPLPTRPTEKPSRSDPATEA
jgi:Lrp/AsnC family transcriptional regulator, leucine-responsive regulatory protein